MLLFKSSKVRTIKTGKGPEHIAGNTQWHWTLPIWKTTDLFGIFKRLSSLENGIDNRRL